MFSPDEKLKCVIFHGRYRFPFAGIKKKSKVSKPASLGISRYRLYFASEQLIIFSPERRT